MSRFCLFKKIFLAIAVILCFGQINARENFSGRHKSSMPVTTADNKPQTKQETFNDYKVDILSGTRNDNLSIKDVVGKIPFTEGVTPSGGKTYTIPITMPPVKSSAPQIALTYNSQAGNGVAGYGWSIAGLSAIIATEKSVYYDGSTYLSNLSSPGSYAFILDGVRLVNYEARGNPDIITPLDPEPHHHDNYDYETAQGFVLVNKHNDGNIIKYFTAYYPNGSTATFGYENNTSPKHIYPITEITDINGYKINFTYIESGNNYYISKISYGGKTPETHCGEIEFIYQDRTDFTTTYALGVAIAANKILKSIVSKSNVNGAWEELCTYNLTHDLTDVNRLTRLDCISGNLSLRPLTFSYNYYEDNHTGVLENTESMLLTQYLLSSNPISKRGKFIKDEYDDGLIIYPRLYPNGEGGYSENQKIIIVPTISSIPSTIEMGENFQTIDAVDVDGDGVDEIVKVNLMNPLGLMITVYKVCGVLESGYGVELKDAFIVQMDDLGSRPRACLFGDFIGNGMTQLLAISYNIKSNGDPVESKFALIDLKNKIKRSETSLFSFGPSDGEYLFPLDLNGDGKMELCFVEKSGTNVYEVRNSVFSKSFTSNSLNRQEMHSRKLLFGDLNADGKIDLLLSPKKMEYTSVPVEMPVWYPHKCPFCSNDEPLYHESEYLENCKYCNRNLREYYEKNPSLVKCRKCGTTLEYCFNSQQKDPEIIALFCCSEHGSSVSSNVTVISQDNGSIWRAFLSTGNGFAVQYMDIIRNDLSNKFHLMDLNCDGYADFICLKNNTITPYLNINGTISSNPGTPLPFNDFYNIVPMNINNYYNTTTFISIKGQSVENYTFTKNNSKANLLTSLTDSYGNKYINRYSDMTMSNSNYFHTGSNFVFPYCSFTAPINLIRQSEINTKTGENISHYSYFYHGAVLHRTGLGFCGFERVDTRNEIEGITVKETREPRMFGLTTKVESPYKESLYEYDNNFHYSNKKSNPSLKYAKEIDKLTGVVTELRYEYNAYNSPTKITETAGSGENAISSITMQSYYGPQQSGYYHVSLPQERTVTSTRNGSSWTTREFIEYDGYLPESRKTYTGAGNSANNKTGETRWTYDSYGNVTSEVSAPYNVTVFRGTTYEYDPSGRFLTSVTNAFGQKTTYGGFDKFGNACNITDHKGRTTTKVFDAWGRQTSETMPDGVTSTTSLRWGGLGCYTVTEKVTGKPDVIVHYDALDRKVRSGSRRFDGSWLFTDYEYDSRGRLYRTSLPFKGSAPLHWNTYQYDGYNRPESYSEASGKTTTWSYNGLSTTETRNGIAATKTTDASGALIRVEDPGGVITYTLRPDGQPSKITAPGNVVTLFGYDSYGRQTSITDPSAGKQTFSESYAADGSLTTTVTDARGQTVTTLYDQYGRLTAVQRPEFSTGYAYIDATLLLSEISNNGTSKTYTYDAYDRPETIRENAPDGKWLKKTFVYNNGNISQVQYESQDGIIGTETSAYKNGHNTEIKFNGTSFWKLTEENNMGQPVKAATGNMERTYGYTAYGMPTSRSVGNIQSFTYDFDTQKGNLRSRKDNTRNKTEIFGYDRLNRLSRIGLQPIIYSDNGNITSMPGVGTMEYGNSAKPYRVTMLTPAGSAVAIRNQTVTYTSFQRPGSITENGITASFTYNAASERTKMHVVQQNRVLLIRYYIGSQYEIDTRSNTNKDEIHRLYLGGDAYSAPAVYVKEGNVWKMYYICRDYLGSITHIANSDGSLKTEYSYDAWGRLRNPNTQVNYDIGSEPSLFLGRGYTGHEHLPWFGLVNMNARLYEPALGRFLSPDPYVQMPDFTQNFNRYSYCLNNPLVYVDENGEFIFSFLLPGIGTFIDAALWGAVIGGAGYTASVAFSPGGFNNWSWGQFGKAVGIGAISGVVTAGIGSVFGPVGSMGIGGEIARAYTHGFANGMISQFSGGDFMQGFAAGGLGSLGGSAFMMYGGSFAASRLGTYAFSGLAGGVGAELTGGNFWEGAAVGVMNAGLNHLQQGISDATLQKIKKDILKDGRLTLKEANKWYRIGNGESLTVDADKIDLDFINPNKWQIGDVRSVQTLYLSNDGRVYGNLTLKYEGNNNFSIMKDTYNFEMHTGSGTKTWFRNQFTKLGSFVAGKGVAYDIYFRGLNNVRNTYTLYKF